VHFEFVASKNTIPGLQNSLKERFQVFTAQSTKMTAFWEAAPCGLAEIDSQDDGGGNFL
jgi:hypothetical protein